MIDYGVIFAAFIGGVGIGIGISVVVMLLAIRRDMRAGWDEECYRQFGDEL